MANRRTVDRTADPVEALKARLPELRAIYPGDRQDLRRIITNLETNTRGADLNRHHTYLTSIADSGEETSQRRAEYRELAKLFWDAYHQ